MERLPTPEQLAATSCTCDLLVRTEARTGCSGCSQTTTPHRPASCSCSNRSQSGRWLHNLVAATYLIFLYSLLFSTVDCIKLLPVHWNSSNHMFHLDNTDHVHDVSIGDMIDIICPQYPTNTPQHIMEQHVLYQVSREEYETCRILHTDNSVTRQVLKCTRPHHLNKLTIVFREYTPVPNGLEYTRGQDYYYISTSTGELSGLYNREGGGCRWNNMRMIFKVCCNNEVSGNAIPIRRIDTTSYHQRQQILGNNISPFYPGHTQPSRGGVERYGAREETNEVYSDVPYIPIMERLQTASSSPIVSPSSPLLVALTLCLTLSLTLLT